MTKVRTSTEDNEPSVNRKKSCARDLPIFYRCVSAVMPGYYSLGLKIILKFVTITLPCSDGTLRKLCSQVMLLTMRYFSSPISTSCSRRPWICYFETIEPSFSMLGREQGSSITILGQSLFFWLFDTPEKPLVVLLWLFFVVCGYVGIFEPVPGDWIIVFLWLFEATIPLSSLAELILEPLASLLLDWLPPLFSSIVGDVACPELLLLFMNDEPKESLELLF